MSLVVTKVHHGSVVNSSAIFKSQVATKDVVRDRATRTLTQHRQERNPNPTAVPNNAPVEPVQTRRL